MNLYLRLVFLSLAWLPLFACSCGGASTPEDLTSRAQDELHSGKHASALSKFRQALETLKPEDAGYLEAKLGAIEARIYGDPAGAQAEFLELAGALPEQIDVRRYCNISGIMANAKQWLPSIAVMDAGMKRFGKDDPKLNQLLEKIKKESAGDAGAKNALDSLGYT
jgi:hypothetical protein